MNNMSKKSDPITLDELRDKSIQSENQIKFVKQMFGGYSKKQVIEYINTLTDNLKNAEECFNNRLEDYASMTTMLKQERDQYGEMYNLCKNSKIEMADQIESLKRENANLSATITSLKTNAVSTENHLLLYKPSPEIDTNQRKLEIYQEYEQESVILKEQLAQLKSMVRDLSAELENYSASNSTVCRSHQQNHPP
jgi:small-conductance mechanosensitive channel